ncbi:uncharacterized protein LOC124176951 isoform X1 [Neodiprion fabricii]|uniref:uncharacterized protein LOC124176950 isoform X3 n=2 Tax=Neodiprion fabricii TaxID=2872261 RepID=UPI001ED96608|nr:uncharacterized protein LOC124176950 isoform X3 [Neodiprion fabricii]XP_046414825.1 uncharacterized protein LOC124176951 isoform X1 [Neodiprion fabricii]
MWINFFSQPFVYTMESSGSFRSSQWKQCLAAFASSLMFYPAVDAVWYHLKSTERYFEFIYLVPSVILVTGGAILAAVCSDFCGRKKTMLASSFFAVLQTVANGGFLPEILTEILNFVYLFHLGFTYTAIFLYISEVTSTNIRQTAMVLPLATDLMIGFILLSVYQIFDSIRAYQVAHGISVLIATVLYIAIILLCPETPYYLNSRDRRRETEQSLSFYTGLRYVRKAELIPEPGDNSRVARYTQQRKDKLREITELKNIHSFGMIFLLILIKWGIGQRNNASFIQAVMGNSGIFHALIVHFASIFFTVILAIAIILFSKKLSLLAVIVISFMATLIGIWIQAPVIISLLIFVKYLGHFIFTGVTWSSVGVSFTTNVRAIAIAIIVSFDVLIGTIVFWIEYQMYQKDPEYHPWYLDVPPVVKSYIDMGTLVVAFILVLIFIPKTIEVQPEEQFENYAVVRFGAVELSQVPAEVAGLSQPLQK